jgi:hypothetical protein
MERMLIRSLYDYPRWANATMITMVSASPPATDLIVYQRIMSGQM